MRALELSKELGAAVEPLLVTHEQLCEQIKGIDVKVEQATKNDERVKRLTTVPSVGAVTALTFIALVDDIGRFSAAAKLCSYLGLVPREYSSGEKQRRRHVTRAGNLRLRSLLVECACGILRRANSQNQALSDWALCVAARRGQRIAAVALARKLVRILFAMTQHGRDYEPDRLRRVVISRQSQPDGWTVTPQRTL